MLSQNQYKKSVITNYRYLSNNINKDFINRDKYNINKYLFIQINTKIENKYKFIKVKRSYCDNNTLDLQQFNLEKRSKTKVVQNVFLIKAKINREVI